MNVSITDFGGHPDCILPEAIAIKEGVLINRFITSLLDNKNRVSPFGNHILFSI